jgi:hypothetical protein
MVSSVPDSNVYVLRFDDEGLVVSELLDTANKAGTANEILRDVLGLDFTIPLWASTRLDDLVSRFSAQRLDEEAVLQLRRELAELGLSDAMPLTLTRIVDEINNDQNQ